MSSEKIDRRIRKTRAGLRSALTKLMMQKPIQEITVREIADSMDINRGTFYLHYKDVFDMLDKIEQEIFEDFNTIISAHNLALEKHTPLPFLNDIFKYFLGNADMAQALLGPYGDHQFVMRLEGLFKDKCLSELMEVYKPKNSVYFDYYYDFVVYGCMGLFKCWLRTGMKESPEEMSALAEKIIMGSIDILDEK